MHKREERNKENSVCKVGRWRQLNGEEEICTIGSLESMIFLRLLWSYPTRMDNSHTVLVTPSGIASVQGWTRTI